jgi:Flp pilus assembly pilin Flp
MSVATTLVISKPLLREQRINTMTSKVQAFLKSEDGAVTVDWVVLTAAIVGLALIVAIPIFSATEGEAIEISTYLGQIAAE